MPAKRDTFDVPDEWRREWPCSKLAGCHVEIAFAENGDLVDLDITRDGEPAGWDGEGAELTAAHERYVYMPQAHELGEEAAKAAASWCIDGNSDLGAARRVLAMLEAGDPAADDYLPRRPDLSGEWADGATPRSVALEIVGAQLDRMPDGQAGELIDALSAEWENGADDAFIPECERLLYHATEPLQVSDMFRGYVACALWSSTHPDTEAPLDDTYSAGDIDTDALTRMRSDCRVFLEANSPELEQFGELTGRDYGSHGHDLWLTRNGHGAGFWDRYMEAAPENRDDAKHLGEALSGAAHGMGECSIYPGDDGKLYIGG